MDLGVVQDFGIPNQLERNAGSSAAYSKGDLK